jgi:hypothetical protein
LIIAVVDGKGGGMGCQVIERLKSLKNNDIEIIALGTNSQATSNMLKSGAHDGATGENAVVIMSGKADIIIGPLAIIAANSMMGEITPKMSCAITSSDAKKLLLPVNKCNIEIMGVSNYQLKAHFNELVETIKKIIEENEKVNHEG